MVIATVAAETSDAAASTSAKENNLRERIFGCSRCALCLANKFAAANECAIAGFTWAIESRSVRNMKSVPRSLRAAIRPTTFIESGRLSNRLGAQVVLASETFQHTGSFKFRAGYNVALSVPQRHIITASSGNFGQGLS